MKPRFNEEVQNYITLNKKTLEEYIEYLQDFEIGQGFFNRTQIALATGRKKGG